MMNPKVQWTLPPPLRNTASPADTARLRARLHEPFILRFASDSFMDEFFQLVQQAPQRLGEWEVEHETWRDPTVPPLPIEEMPRLTQRLFRLRASLADQAVGLVPAGTLLPIATPSPPAEPLKLFQPAHQRFYLVTAGLVCRLPGLPEKHLATGGVERVSFVVRRLWPKDEDNNPAVWNTTTCDQYAYAARGSKFEWQPVDEDTVLPNEERNPLFRVAYPEAGQQQHLWAGLVPVGKREAYLGAVRATAAAESPAAETDPRPDLLEMQVMAPWNAIIAYKESRNALSSSDNVPPYFDDYEPPNPLDPDDPYVKTTTDQIHQQSWYALLDMAEFLEKYLNDVWVEVNKKTAANDTGWVTDDPRRILLSTLQEISDGKATLAIALKAVIDENDTYLDGDTVVYDDALAGKWPDLKFDITVIAANLETVRTLLDDRLSKEIVAALPPPPDTMPPPPFAAQQAQRPINEPAWFVIRCVYERPFCGPTIAPPSLSTASRPFQMASFFDPDAPARPIRIALPMDTSPAGLRKFDRNTAFMMSDALCGQVSKMRELSLGDLVRAVLPWPLHKDLDLSEMGLCSEGDSGQVGVVCSLSIPIVTICALILLLMIVSLLDMIFRWMPYFIACFPIFGSSKK
ncbi:MAG: hypothetical protein H6668_21230 [Ardenticatenaceae bacterium]|nr:hypothetical protein [Ardenticatenaceae bacterium]